MQKQYLVWLLLAMATVLVACGGEATPVAETFNKYSAQAIFDGLDAAGLGVTNQRRDMAVAPDVPVTYSDRYLFEIEKIAPAGGQVLIFNNADGLATWQTYVDQQRANSSTRRDYVYVYTKNNALLILSPNLTTDDATAYREAFERLP